jgi:hypothetical protein
MAGKIYYVYSLLEHKGYSRGREVHVPEEDNPLDIDSRDILKDLMILADEESTVGLGDYCPLLNDV